MNPQTALLILKMLDVLALGLRTAPDIMVKYKDLREKIGQMVEEGRDPTPEEWAELDAETEELMSRLKSD